MHRAVDEEILAQFFRRYIAFAHIGPVGGCKPLGVAAGRQHPVKIHIRLAGDQVAHAVLVHAEPVDLFEDARSVRVIGLAGMGGGCAGIGAVVFPRTAISLSRHIG